MRLVPYSGKTFAEEARRLVPMAAVLGGSIVFTKGSWGWAYLVARHVIIFGHGPEFTARIVDESQHRTPECSVMAQH